MAKVLVYGADGRAHAIGWGLAQDPEVEIVYHTPGTGGTGKPYETKGKNILPVGANRIQLANFVKKESIDLVVISPEQPLAEGLVDYLYEQDIHRVIGCTKVAAQLEADKFFSYELNEKLEIPQAYSKPCTTIKDIKDAIEEISKISQGVVLKARGLHQGKGVKVYDSKKLAIDDVVRFTYKYGNEILVCERLYGKELTLFGLSNGSEVIPFEMSFRDYKRAKDGDKGLNTGGMGAYCPVAGITPQTIQYVTNKIMTPVVKKMKERGKEFKGILYVGLMLTEENPKKIMQGLKVLEYNVRLGSPEWEAGAMILDDSLYKIFSDSLDGKLKRIKFKQGGACTIVLASKGYPENYKTELPIDGLNLAESMNGVKVFHAGTKLKENGQGKKTQLVTAGGRVFMVSAYSPLGVKYARELGYYASSKIHIPGGFDYRKDIARKGLR